MAYKNYMEEAVIEQLNEILGQIDVCNCEKCKEDMVCWTLNRLPAKYVSTELGSIYTKINQMKIQSKTDIVVCLTEAAKIIKAAPRH